MKRELAMDHMVIGGGLFGLALARELSRLPGESVVVVEERESLPRLGWDGTLLLLPTGLDAYRELEEAGWRELAVILDDDDRESPELSSLQSTGHREGSLESGPLRAKLETELRQAGVRFLLGVDIDHVHRRGDRFQTEGSDFDLDAGRVYLTGEKRDRGILEEHGVQLALRRRVWQEFRFAEAPPEPLTIRISSAPYEPPSEGLPLEVDDEACGPGGDRPVLHGNGEQLLLLAPDGRDGRGEAEPSVEWRTLTTLRAEHGDRVPALRASVHCARARSCLELAPNAPGILSACEGRLLSAGAFGIHDTLLAFGVARELARRVSS